MKTKWLPGNKNLYSANLHAVLLYQWEFPLTNVLQLINFSIKKGTKDFLAWTSITKKKKIYQVFTGGLHMSISFGQRQRIHSKRVKASPLFVFFFGIDAIFGVSCTDILPWVRSYHYYTSRKITEFCWHDCMDPFSVIYPDTLL